MLFIYIHFRKGYSLRGGEVNRVDAIFLLYSLYGWGLPILIISVSVIMDLSPTIPSTYLKPNFGLDSCWFHSKFYCWKLITVKNIHILPIPFKINKGWNINANFSHIFLLCRAFDLETRSSSEAMEHILQCANNNYTKMNLYNVSK